MSNAIAVSAGGQHSMALLANGTVMDWGQGSCGQLGNGMSKGSAKPVAVSGLSGVDQIAAGGYHNLALRSDGTVWAWGDNGSGQLGDGTNTGPEFCANCPPKPGVYCSETPIQVNNLTDVTQISGGNYDSMALLANGSAMSWGYNGNGQLGDGSHTNQDNPVPITGLTDVIQVSAGFQNGMALLANGTVMDWGFNHDGQLGNGTNQTSRTPVAVTGLSGETAVSSGNEFELATP